ncbi:MAG: hypothetical protein MZV65_34040 [Chromatiales bacterium]|nr:hypothetical protein [Chromatiales bacterium]
MQHLDNNHPKAVELICADAGAPRPVAAPSGRRERPPPGGARASETTLAAINHATLARLARLAPATLAAEVATLARYASSQLAAQPDLPVHACAALAAWPGGELEQRVYWHGLAALLLTGEGAWRKAVNVRIGFPARTGTAARPRTTGAMT